METVQHITWRQRLEAYYYLCRFDKPIGTELVFGQPCGRYGLHLRAYLISRYCLSWLWDAYLCVLQVVQLMILLIVK